MSYAIVSTCGYVETAHVSRMVWLPCDGVVYAKPWDALRGLAVALLKAYRSAITEWSSDQPTFDEYDFMRFVVGVCSSASVDCKFPYDDDSYDIYGSVTDLLSFDCDHVIDIYERFEHVMLRALTRADVSTVFTTEVSGEYDILSKAIHVHKCKNETYRVEIP